jgi:hypothetical protein
MWGINTTDTFDVLCAGNKAGNEKRFYQEMIPIADREYAAHLEGLKRKNNHGKNT